MSLNGVMAVMLRCVITLNESHLKAYYYIKMVSPGPTLSSTEM